MRKLHLVALAMCGILLQSCMTIPVAQVGSEEAKESLSFKPVANKAVVYLYRAKQSQYGLYGIDVTFNGKSVTMGDGFLRVTMDPGEYTAIIDLPELTSQEDEFHLNAKAGSVTFLEMHLKARMFIGGVTSLKQVPKDEAIKYIMNTKMIAQKPIHL